MNSISALIFAVVLSALALLPSARLSAKPMDVIDVIGNDIFIEGAEGNFNVGDRLIAIDFDGKQVAVVEIVKKNVSSGQIEWIAKQVHGTEDVRPGYSVKVRPLPIGATFLEYSLLRLDRSATKEYYDLDGSEPPKLTQEGALVSWGFIISANPQARSQLYGNVATTYIDLGEIKVWDIFDFGVTWRPEIKREVAYFSLNGVIGLLGATFGKVDWKRPAGSVDTASGAIDVLKKDEGQAKVRTLGGGLMFTYRFYAAFTYNVNTTFGVQLRAGYLGFWYDKFVDSEIPEDISIDEESGWRIDETWLEQDIGSSAVSIGIALVVNLSDAGFGDFHQ